MKLTDKEIAEYFPTDKRFVHYVSRKRGGYFANEEDLERAEFYSMEALIRRRGTEYENKSHMNSAAEWAVRSGISKMIKYKEAKKRKAEVYNESSFYTDADDSRSILDRLTDEQPEIDNLITDAEHCLIDRNSELIKLLVQGYTVKEIAERQGVTYAAVNNRKQRLVKQIRKFYEYETQQRPNRTDSEDVPARVWSEPVKEDEKTGSNSSEALAYLNLIK